jgi:hypothetical protein
MANALAAFKVFPMKINMANVVLTTNTGLIHTDNMDNPLKMNLCLRIPISFNLNEASLFMKNCSKAFILMNFIEENSSLAIFVL